MLIRRSDAAVLNAPVRTSAGTTYTARVASDGPLKYLAADGSVQIERRSIDVLKSIVDQLPGIELTVDHPDGMLRPGDGVTRVNGFPIERPEQAQTAFESLDVASELRVAYDREGEPREIVYRITDDP